VVPADHLRRSAVFPDPAPGTSEAQGIGAAPPTAAAAAAPAPPDPSSCAANSARLPGRGAVAAFLGDSYTTGWTGTGIGRRGWPALVGASFGWRIVNRAVAGTGFVNPGWTRQPVATRVASVIRARPDVVFLASGHNDRRYATGAVARAADAVIDRLRPALPNATIVVIGPIWQDGAPAASIVRLRDHLRRKAAATGALFIDPLAGRWFAGASHRFIKADGIHPDDAGHRFIAGRVLAVLANATGSATAGTCS
jgi:lysophospholipase L1-like esterase